MIFMGDTPAIYGLNPGGLVAWGMRYSHQKINKRAACAFDLSQIRNMCRARHVAYETGMMSRWALDGG